VELPTARSSIAASNTGSRRSQCQELRAGFAFQKFRLPTFRSGQGPDVAALRRALRQRHPPAFDRDLAEKTCVFLGRDVLTGEVGGFSTARFYLHHSATRLVGIYFSGDTIILPAYWGEGGLHRAVMGAMARWKLAHPRIPLYWHLICSGYRTYLTLARNFPVHWPHHERPTPPEIRELLHSVCRRDMAMPGGPTDGVIAVEGPQPVLKAAVAPFTPAVLALPEVAFFVAANPGYADGDELAMLAPLTPGRSCAWPFRQDAATPTVGEPVNATSPARGGGDLMRSSIRRKPVPGLGCRTGCPIRPRHERSAPGATRGPAHGSAGHRRIGVSAGPMAEPAARIRRILPPASPWWTTKTSVPGSRNRLARCVRMLTVDAPIVYEATSGSTGSPQAGPLHAGDAADLQRLVPALE
jgi:hypothetical protein